MIESTVNIPFKVKLETDSNYFGYVEHDLLSAQTYAKASKAKDYFRKQITEDIEEGLRAKKNSQARAIGCVNGTVFVVRYSIGSWHYSIVGPDRKGGSIYIGENSFDGAYNAAKRHVEQMGGIAWECSL